MDKKEIKMDVVMEVSEERAGDKLYRTRVVRWNNGRPKLERREYYMKDGKEFMSKCTGLDDENFQLVLQKAEKIGEALTYIKEKKS